MKQKIQQTLMHTQNVVTKIKRKNKTMIHTELEPLLCERVYILPAYNTHFFSSVSSAERGKGFGFLGGPNCDDSTADSAVSLFCSFTSVPSPGTLT